LSNIQLNAGTGGATLGTDTVGGIDYQKVKPAFSADGTTPVSVSAANPLPVTVGNFPASQPVSGTVTANQGTANTVANAWPIEVTDGTRTAAVKAASTAAVAADQALVVAVSPNNSVAVTIAGTVAENLTQVANTVLGTPQTFGTAPSGVVIGTSSDLYIAGTRAVASAAGVQKVGIVGNAGATVDQAQGSAVPTNGIMVGGGSVAGGTNFEALTVKAASTAAAATDTSLVVQPLVGSAVMATAAAGVQKVGIVGNTGATLDAASGSAVPTNGQLVGGGSVAGGTTFEAMTVKAASVAAAATDTSLVVQTLIGSNAQRTNQTTTAAGVVDVNLVGVLGVTNSATNGAFARITDNTTAITAAVSALGTAPTGTDVMAVNAVMLPSAAAGAACTLFQNSAVTTAVVVKASAGNLYGFMVNGGTSTNFLQFINAASAPTLGTAAVFSVQIPASGIVLVPPGAFALDNFTTGISLGISTTYNGATAGTAAAVIAFYK